MWLSYKKCCIEPSVCQKFDEWFHVYSSKTMLKMSTLPPSGQIHNYIIRSLLWWEVILQHLHDNKTVQSFISGLTYISCKFAWYLGHARMLHYMRGVCFKEVKNLETLIILITSIRHMRWVSSACDATLQRKPALSQWWQCFLADNKNELRYSEWSCTFSSCGVCCEMDFTMWHGYCHGFECAMVQYQCDLF